MLDPTPVRRPTACARAREQKISAFYVRFAGLIILQITADSGNVREEMRRSNRRNTKKKETGGDERALEASVTAQPSPTAAAAATITLSGGGSALLCGALLVPYYRPLWLTRRRLNE